MTKLRKTSKQTKTSFQPQSIKYHTFRSSVQSLLTIDDQLCSTDMWVLLFLILHRFDKFVLFFANVIDVQLFAIFFFFFYYYYFVCQEAVNNSFVENWASSFVWRETAHLIRCIFCKDGHWANQHAWFLTLRDRSGSVGISPVRLHLFAWIFGQVEVKKLRNKFEFEMFAVCYVLFE